MALDVFDCCGDPRPLCTGCNGVEFLSFYEHPGTYLIHVVCGHVEWRVLPGRAPQCSLRNDRVGFGRIQRWEIECRFDGQMVGPSFVREDSDFSYFRTQRSRPGHRDIC